MSYVLTDIAGSVSRPFHRNVLFVIMVMFVAFIFVSHYEGVDNGFFDNLAKRYPNNTWAKWAKANYQQAEGSLVLVTGALGVPEQSIIFALILAAFGVVLLKGNAIFGYLLFATAILVVFNSRRAGTRFAAIALCALLFVLGAGKFDPRSSA